MRHNAIDRTLARRNLEVLREAGITVDSAYRHAEQWALFDIEVMGHRYADGKLLIRLRRTEPGFYEYERELNLGRDAA